MNQPAPHSAQAARAALGLGQSCIMPAVSSLSARWVPAAQRGRCTSLIYACYSAGTVAGLALTPFLAQQVRQERALGAYCMGAFCWRSETSMPALSPGQLGKRVESGSWARSQCRLELVMAIKVYFLPLAGGLAGDICGVRAGRGGVCRPGNLHAAARGAGPAPTPAPAAGAAARRSGQRRQRQHWEHGEEAAGCWRAGPPGHAVLHALGHQLGLLHPAEVRFARWDLRAGPALHAGLCALPPAR